MISPKSASPAERLALRYLEDLIFEEVYEAGEARRGDEMRCFKEMGAGGAAAAARELLGESQRVLYRDRRWHLAAWHRLRRRTHEGALRAYLEWAGKPLALPPLAREFGRAFSSLPEKLLPLLTRLVSSAPDIYLAIADEQVGLTEWFFVPPDRRDTPYEALLSLEETDIVDTLHDQLGEDLVPADGNWASYLDALCQAWGEPIPNRVVQYLQWRQAPKNFAPGAAFLALLGEDSLHLFSGCLWAGPQMAKETRETLHKVLQETAAEVGEEESAVDLGEILDASKDDGARAILTEEDQAELLEAVSRSATPVAVDTLVNQLFEMTPGHEDFRPVALTVMEHLDAQQNLQRVGRWRWLRSKNIPAEIFSVPRGVELEEVVVISAEGEDVDFALGDEGLEEDLLEFVGDPRYEDYGEESASLDAPPPVDRTQCVLAYHHHEGGALYVRAVDRGVLPAEPRIYQATAYYQGQREYALWLNNETRLLFGLEDFYREYCPPSGAVFALRTGEREGELAIDYDGERDPAVAIEEERLVELLDLHKKAAQAEWAVFEMMQELMRTHQKGIEVRLLHAETNVVRRTPRRVLASLLASYHCFHQKKEGGEWYFDERKVSQGIKKAKRKYILR